MLLEKNSPLTPYVNHLLSRLRAGGLIKHYWDDPLYLEQTMSVKTFTFYDDSKDKLTLDTFFLTFVFLGSGMVLSLLALLVEILVFKYNTRIAAQSGNTQGTTRTIFDQETARPGNTQEAGQTRNSRRVAWAEKSIKFRKSKPKAEPRSMYDGSDD